MKPRAMAALALRLFLILPVIQACGGGEVSSETTSSPGRIVPFSEFSVSPPEGEVAAGETFDRTVNIVATGPAFFSAFDMTYDPTIVEFLGAKEGGFFNRNGADPTSFRAILEDGTPGRITVGLTRLGQTGDVVGKGNLLTLTFRALNPGATLLAFSSPRGLKSSENQTIPIGSWENGIVTVR